MKKDTKHIRADIVNKSLNYIYKYIDTNITLDELAKPERVARIKADHEKALKRAKRKIVENPLRPNTGEVDLDDIYGGGKGCVICHK